MGWHLRWQRKNLKPCPEVVDHYNAAGLCTEVATLYSLIQLSKKAPVEAEKLCKRGAPIARRDVAALEEKVGQERELFPRQKEPIAAGEEGAGKQKTALLDETLRNAGGNSSAVTPTLAAGPTDDQLKRPLLEVTYEGQLAYLELHKRARYGRGWIRVLSSGEALEVPLLAVAIQAIVEGEG